MRSLAHLKNVPTSHRAGRFTKRLSLSGLDRSNICGFEQEHSCSVNCETATLLALMTVTRRLVETQRSASPTALSLLHVNRFWEILLYWTDFYFV